MLACLCQDACLPNQHLVVFPLGGKRKQVTRSGEEMRKIAADGGRARDVQLSKARKRAIASQGGEARRKSLSPGERKEIARKAAAARWKGKRKKR